MSEKKEEVHVETFGEKVKEEAKKIGNDIKTEYNKAAGEAHLIGEDIADDFAKIKEDM